MNKMAIPVVFFHGLEKPPLKPPSAPPVDLAKALPERDFTVGYRAGKSPEKTMHRAGATPLLGRQSRPNATPFRMSVDMSLRGSLPPWAQPSAQNAFCTTSTNPLRASGAMRKGE